MSKPRVRFAPSPTGFFHIGSARTALFNWLYARHTNGTFILRIEDTDAARNTDESLHALMDGMAWLNLDWDEGPKFGADGRIIQLGNHGPYFQSQRADVYLEYLEILRKNGRAYDKDGAVFFKVSGETQTLNDAVYGDVSRMEEKDFPIFRSNGTPVFHFVNVVDDIAMEITNVIRGQDHLTNTNKHIELFKAFGAPMPQFAHIPLILKSDGEGKMSKRDKGALIEEYRQKNFLPDAVRNYLCLLGWNPKNGREIMPIDEIIELFDFPGVVRSNARFDERKMAHFNTEHLRALDISAFSAVARAAFEDEISQIETPKAGPAELEENRTPLSDEQKSAIVERNRAILAADKNYADKVFALCQPKVVNLESFGEFTSYFFTEEFSYDEGAKQRVFKKGDPLARMREAMALIKETPEADFTSAGLHDAFEKLAAASTLKITDYFPPLRFGVSGLAGGPDLLPMLEAMGKSMVERRLGKTLENFA